jgi:hypothetical protein
MAQTGHQPVTSLVHRRVDQHDLEPSARRDLALDHANRSDPHRPVARRTRLHVPQRMRPSAQPSYLVESRSAFTDSMEAQTIGIALSEFGKVREDIVDALASVVIHLQSMTVRRPAAKPTASARTCWAVVAAPGQRH